jgi:DsbC/DsbD-like thiol-disulfide interchange protein
MTSETMSPMEQTARICSKKIAFATQRPGHVARERGWIMPVFEPRYIAFALALAIGSMLSVRAAPPADLVRAQLVADTAAIQPGQPLRIGVLLKIAPQWHVYWQNAGEGGVPTTVTLRLPEGFTASSIQYPVPKRFALNGGLHAYGYEDEVMLLATITPPAKIESSNISISADANWLVCEKVCVAGDVNLNLSLPVSDSARPDHEDLFKTWLAKLPLPISSTKDVASQHQSFESGKLTIRIDWKGQAPADIEWFPPASDALNFSKIQVDAKDKSTTISATVEQLPGQKVSEKLPDSVVAYRTASGRVGIALPVNLSGTSKE